MSRIFLTRFYVNVYANEHSKHITVALPKIDKKYVEERSQTADKSLAGTLMSTLTTMKFDDSRTMHEHVIEMTCIAARLKSLRIEVDENFLGYSLCEESRSLRESCKETWKW